MLTRYKTSLTLRSPKGALDIESVWAVLERWVQDNDGVSIGSENQKRALPNGTRIVVENWRGLTSHQRALRYERRTKTHEAWTADVGLDMEDRQALVYVALGHAVLSRDRIPRSPVYPPRFVRELLIEFEAYAGLRLDAHHRDVSRPSDIDSFIDLIVSTQRQRPLLVVSVDPYSEKPLLDPLELEKRLVGLAHVVVLGKAAGLEFRRRLEKRIGQRERVDKWTVYGGAARIYWPGVDPASVAADPFRHRLWLPDDMDERTVEAIFRQAADDAIVRHDPNWVNCDSVRAATLEASRGDRDAQDELLDEQAAKVATIGKQNEDLQYQLEEAHSRATEAERSVEMLRYRLSETTKTLESYKARLPQDTQSTDGDRLTLAHYRRGNRAERDCVEEMLQDFPDERERVLDALHWLTDPASWDITNKSHRLSLIEDDLWEFRVNVANHWFRFFLRRAPRLAIVAILHCYPKQQNKLDATEVDCARERAKEMLA